MGAIYLSFDQISVPYIFVFISTFIWYKLKSDQKPLLVNNFIIAVLSLFVLILFVLDLFEQVYLGYIYEYFAFNRQVYGESYMSIIWLKIIVFLLSFLNFLNKIRRKLNFQILIFLLHIILIIMAYSTLKTPAVIPGWHTTIIANPPLSNYFVIIVIWLLVTFGGSYLKKAIKKGMRIFVKT